MISIVNDKHDDFNIKHIKEKYPNSNIIHYIYKNCYNLCTLYKNSYKLYSFMITKYFYIYKLHGYTVMMIHDNTNIQVIYKKPPNYTFIEHNNKYFYNNNIEYTTRYKLFIYRNYCNMQYKIYCIKWLYTDNINTIKNINKFRLYRNMYFI